MLLFQWKYWFPLEMYFKRYLLLANLPNIRLYSCKPSLFTLISYKVQSKSRIIASGNLNPYTKSSRWFFLFKRFNYCPHFRLIVLIPPQLSSSTSSSSTWYLEGGGGRGMLTVADGWGCSRARAAEVNFSVTRCAMWDDRFQRNSRVESCSSWLSTRTCEGLERGMD